MTTTGPGAPEDVLDHIADGDDLIVPLANGEPVSVLDAIEANAARWQGVRVHQMHALHDRPYLHGATRGHLDHVSYFLSSVTRPAFHERGCELVPNHFSEVPRILRESTRCSLVLAAAAPMDRPRVLLAGHELRLRRAVHRARSVLPRGQRTDAAHLRREPGARQRRRRAGPRWIDRSSRSRRPRPLPSRNRSQPTSPRASPTAPRSKPASAPSRTPSSRACADTATSACTPSCSRTRWSISSSGAW